MLTRAAQAASQLVLGRFRTVATSAPDSLDLLSNGTRQWKTIPDFGSAGCGRGRGCNQSGDTLATVQEKNKKLRLMLQELSWPRLEGFEARGKLFQLPLCRQERPLSETRQPAALRLGYLAGFFDGDGCVSSRPDLSGCTLGIAQSFDKPEILLLFRDTFGGSITKTRDGIGLRKPVLVWRIGGNMARCASQILSAHSIHKKRQLLLAASWPEEQADRQAAAVELQTLKHYDSAVVKSCSLEYFAGFFDAEGNIGQRGHTTLFLSVAQKYATVLHCLQGFLQSGFGVNAALRSRTDSYRLDISGSSACKSLLHEMLQAGLTCKAGQAEIAIGLTRKNCTWTRSALATMVGNQRFGQRLDKAGVERAIKIQHVQKRAGCLLRRGEVKEAEAKLQEAAELKEEHQLLNAQREHQELLQYIDWIQGLQGSFWHLDDKGMCESREKGVSLLFSELSDCVLQVSAREGAHNSQLTA